MSKLSAPLTLPSIAVVVFNHFSPFHVSVPTLVFGPETLREAFFDLVMVAGEDGPLTSSLGMEMHPSHGLEALAQVDIIVLPYWHDVAARPSEALLEALVAAHQRGAKIIGLCLGAYVLAYAGLLSGKRAATHWELEADFTERFQDVSLDTNALYVEDAGLITSAGTAASIDCCLYVFRQYYSTDVVNRLARRMVVSPHRDGGQAQFIERPVPETTADARINALLTTIRQALDKPYTLDALAESVMMTRRTFTRKFHQATGMSLGEWLAAERLQLAQELLATTDCTMEQIVMKTGFSSTLTFREKFKQRFAVTPNQWRKSFHQ